MGTPNTAETPTTPTSTASATARRPGGRRRPARADARDDRERLAVAAPPLREPGRGLDQQQVAGPERRPPEPAPRAPGRAGGPRRRRPRTAPESRPRGASGPPRRTRRRRRPRIGGARRPPASTGATDGARPGRARSRSSASTDPVNRSRSPGRSTVSGLAATASAPRGWTWARKASPRVAEPGLLHRPPRQRRAVGDAGLEQALGRDRPRLVAAPVGQEPVADEPEPRHDGERGRPGDRREAEEPELGAAAGDDEPGHDQVRARPHQRRRAPDDGGVRERDEQLRRGHARPGRTTPGRAASASPRAACC